jgi:predicted nucleic acid-binding protein
VLNAAAALFKPHGSKHNTIFDAIVAALAQKHHAQAIFSFDDWYEKSWATARRQSGISHKPNVYTWDE